VNEADVKRWFDSYLAEFVALGRGEIEDVRRILAHYRVSMIVGVDAGCMVLTDETQVLAAAEQQIGGMRSAAYNHSDVLAAETIVLNQCCATHHGRFARVRAEGTEISQVEATYLINRRRSGPAHFRAHRPLDAIRLNVLVEARRMHAVILRWRPRIVRAGECCAAQVPVAARFASVPGTWTANGLRRIQVGSSRASAGGPSSTRRPHRMASG
jgi:hypothetical protein